MLLGRSAGGLFWMARYTERAEATARLLDTGLHMALTRGAGDADWRAILASSGAAAVNGPTTQARVSEILLRDPSNPSSICASIEAARSNARMVRTSLSREVWEAINQAWRAITGALAQPVAQRELPELLELVKHSSATIHGALTTTMLRNDIYNFVELGTAVERADMTARILDVKYHVLLPSVEWVGSALDSTQWDTILRSVSAHKSYRWLYGGEVRPSNVVSYLVLDPRMPRSLAFCTRQITAHLRRLAGDYGETPPSHATAQTMHARLAGMAVSDIFDTGLHEFLRDFIRDNARFSQELARDYRFIEGAL